MKLLKLVACLVGIATLLAAASIAHAQNSQLPPCPGSYSPTWSNCVGTETWSSGNNYVGEFRDGKLHGQGTYNYAKGDKYVGEFKDNTFHGQGTYYFLAENQFKGDKYVGEYRDDKKTGWGVYTFADGRQYVGEWADGKNNGLGIFYDSQKQPVRSGKFQDNKLVESLRLDPVRFAYVSQPNLATAKPAPNPTPVTSTTNTDEQRRQAAEIERLRLENERAREDKRRAEEALAAVKQQQLQQSVSSPPPQRVQSIASLGQRRALVIGNDNYKLISKLVNARGDARAMAESLRSVGYQVSLHVDATEKDMKAALRTFATQVQGGDEVVFFFSGHGVEITGTNYLLPVDVAGDSEAQVRDDAIQLQRLLDDMKEKRARFTLAMIDACRDNPFVDTGKNIGGRGLAATAPATGQMVIYAAGVGQKALDRLGPADKNPNGLFTRVFLQEMKKPGVSVDRVLRNVRSQVVELAATVGREQVPAIYDQVVGEFYFKK